MPISSAASFQCLIFAAELIGTATASKDGLMSKTVFSSCPKKFYGSNELIVELKTGGSPYERTFALVVGNISNKFLAFLWGLSFNNVENIDTHIIYALANKDVVEENIRIYRKDETYYLAVSASDQYSNFYIMSNANTRQIYNYIDNTYVGVTPTVK